MAVRQGFEPWEEVKAPSNGLANRRLQPLGHLTASGCASRRPRGSLPYHAARTAAQHRPPQAVPRRTPPPGCGRTALPHYNLNRYWNFQVVYRLKHSFRDGTTHVVLDPIEFIARLAALVPRPRAHLTRYHGVFAPNFKHRLRIIPNSVHQSAREPHAPRPAPMSWMQRLKRVFHIDIERCDVCGGTLRVIACIETPELIETILTHLATREAHPRAPPPGAPAAQPRPCPAPTLSLTAPTDA